MQKVTYINLLNESIVFGNTPPYILSSVTGLGAPDIDYETTRGAYQHGESIAGFRRAAPPVGVTFSIVETTREGLYQTRQALQGILSPDRAMDGEARATFIYENDFGRWYTPVMPDGGLAPDKRILNVQPLLKMSFKRESPFWYAMSDEGVEFSYTPGGFELPFSFPISFGSRDYSKDAVNAGHVNAPVEIWIECKGETPRLVNRSTGHAIELSGPVPTGNTLYIRTDPAHLDATLTDAGGVVTPAFGRLSLDTPMAEFYLRPGLNSLVYETGGEGSTSVIRVRWRPMFEGV